MNALPPRKIKPCSLPKVRKKPRRTSAIKCRAHVNWVLENYQCIATGKVSKITGEVHRCWGRLDPHHSPTRGAGGGDDGVSPVCRGLHSLIDSPKRSEKSVQDEYDIDFRMTARDLWNLDWTNRTAYERKAEGSR